MKKVLSLFFVGSLLLTGCQMTTKENQQHSYENQELGISFQNPEGWPEPVLEDGEAYFGPMASLLENKKSNWTLWLGEEEKGSCEGTDCYTKSISGFPSLEYDVVLALLKNDEFVQVREEKVINGNKVVIYSAPGIAENIQALFFSDSELVEFSDQRSEELNEEILSSLDFL